MIAVTLEPDRLRDQGRSPRLLRPNTMPLSIDIGEGYVPGFIPEEVLPSAPTAGQGVHRFLFDLARVLAR